MPFIGKNPTSGFSTIVKDDLTPDGSTTAFTLSKNVASANDIAVFVGNVRQEPTDAYSVSGTTLTMTAAPSSGVNFYVLHIAGTLESSVVPAAGTTVPGNFGVSGDLTVDTNAFHVNATNDHIGFGTTSPATTNGAVTKVIGAKSSQNNILSGETGGIGYSGWIIEARQTGRTGQARFSQIILNTDGSDNGQMLFQNAASGGDVTESIRVSSSGLSFDSGSNYLNDYEEGTFTPTIIRSSVNPSYTASTAQGHYTKIGNVVHLQIMIVVNSVSSSGSGNMRISGLPFGAGTAPTYSHVLNVGYNDTFDSSIKDCYVSGSELQMIPTGITQSNYGGVLSTGYLGICGTYLTT